MTLNMLPTGARVYHATSEFEDGRDGLGHPEPGSKTEFRAEVWDDYTVIRNGAEVLVLPTRHIPDFIEFMKGIWSDLVYK